MARKITMPVVVASAEVAILFVGSAVTWWFLHHGVGTLRPNSPDARTALRTGQKKANTEDVSSTVLIRGVVVANNENGLIVGERDGSATVVHLDSDTKIYHIDPITRTRQETDVTSFAEGGPIVVWGRQSADKSVSAILIDDESIGQSD